MSHMLLHVLGHSIFWDSSLEMLLHAIFMKHKYIFNLENNQEHNQVQTTKIIEESTKRSKGCKEWTVELIDPLKNRYKFRAFNSLDEATTVYDNFASELSQKIECHGTLSNIHDTESDSNGFLSADIASSADL
ncbi:unnamed protein product [Spirodela intermedia]|uniref:Uncharacterized protein n=1 Tax=Spirodela intermedia TaxID=51605 RepID=A0A7I8L7A6_SPIIN|nr:unnamed protein product [Spirodela intermedia]